jgi:DNA-binding NarL/FixJ family response regulator
MERHVVQTKSNEEFIGDTAELAATDRNTRTRKGKVVWLRSKEARVPVKTRTALAVNKGLLAAATDSAVVKEGLVQADVLHCSAVVGPASSSGVDIMLFIKVRAHGFSLGTAELTAVSQAAFDDVAYVPTSLSDKASAGEEPSLDAAKELAGSAPATLEALSVRQREVLSLIVRGMSNKQIARALKLCEGTVKIHVAALFRKLGIHGRAAAAVEGARLLSQL